MPPALSQIIDIIFTEIGKMWWFFLLSIFLVGVIKGYKLDLKIRDHLDRRGLAGVFIAVAVGLVSPLCACGILPIVITLAMVGTPLPALIALLVTSPVMGPDAFLLTWQGLSPEWAVMKLAGAIFLGLFSGVVIHLLLRFGIISGDTVKLKPVFREDGSLAPAVEIGKANDIEVKTMTIIPRASRVRFILDRTWDAGLFVGKFLLLAIILEAILLTFVPQSLIVSLVGNDSFASIGLAALLGLPLPTSQIPMIPIMAGLLNLGMGKGAAYTLLMAGPVSSLPAIFALVHVFDKRVMISYLGSAVVGSVMLGLGVLFFGL